MLQQNTEQVLSHHTFSSEFLVALNLQHPTNGVLQHSESKICLHSQVLGYIYWTVLVLVMVTGQYLNCIVSIHLYSASCSAHQSEALPVREIQREGSSLERTKRGTWLTS